LKTIIIYSDSEVRGVEIVGDQEFFSLPDYDCSVWCICKEQVAISQKLWERFWKAHSLK